MREFRCRLDVITPTALKENRFTWQKFDGSKKTAVPLTFDSEPFLEFFKSRCHDGVPRLRYHRFSGQNFLAMFVKKFYCPKFCCDRII